MSKFLFYITDLGQGLVSGTNDEKLANELSQSEDFFVVNSETGKWLNSDGSQFEVEDFDGS